MVEIDIDEEIMAAERAMAEANEVMTPGEDNRDGMEERRRIIQTFA
jgi:hypothetical protein